MKILVLGAGIIGVTSAYVLATRGYQVEVIDRGTSAAAECSFANGGQLSYSHAEPWATPATPLKALKWLFDKKAPLVIQPQLDAGMMKWGLKFLANCTQGQMERNTLTLLRLGLYSRKMMNDLASATGIEFDHRRDGILHIFSKQAEFDAARKQAEFQQKFGCNETTKTPDECLNLEPALQHRNINLIGGIHAHLDETGNVHQFTSALAAICEKELGVKFHYNTTIETISHKGNAIESIKTDKGDFTADNYVAALGAHTPLLLREIGVKTPIYPMKGYSLTFKAHEYTPKISMTDQKAKIVYTPMVDRLRVAGTAEFAGYSQTINRKRIKILKQVIKDTFPKIIKNETSLLSEWACLRPSTPDGPPMIGTTPFSNLYINAGHGTLGWTQSAGSAFLLADVVEGKETEISLDGLEYGRFV